MTFRLGVQERMEAAEGGGASPYSAPLPPAPAPLLPRGAQRGAGRQQSSDHGDSAAICYLMRR